MFLKLVKYIMFRVDLFFWGWASVDDPGCFIDPPESVYNRWINDIGVFQKSGGQWYYRDMYFYSWIGPFDTRKEAKEAKDIFAESFAAEHEKWRTWYVDVGKKCEEEALKRKIEYDKNYKRTVH
jgi:hypothetical protein